MFFYENEEISQKQVPNKPDFKNENLKKKST